MNIEIEKKEYVSPAMTVIVLEGDNAPILCSSDCLLKCAESDDADDPWDFE